MKNFLLIQIINILHTYENKKLPLNISYAIMKNLMILEKEYYLYKKQLDAIFEQYDNDMIKDSNNNITYSDNGLPLVNDAVCNDFYKQIEELLNLNICVNLYTIEKDSFKCNNPEYFDALTPKEVSVLYNILCEPDFT